MALKHISLLRNRRQHTLLRQHEISDAATHEFYKA